MTTTEATEKLTEDISAVKGYGDGPDEPYKKATCRVSGIIADFIREYKPDADYTPELMLETILLACEENE